MKLHAAAHLDERPCQRPGCLNKAQLRSFRFAVRSFMICERRAARRFIGALIEFANHAFDLRLVWSLEVFHLAGRQPAIDREVCICSSRLLKNT
jgi:hypothetical protein